MQLYAKAALNTAYANHPSNSTFLFQFKLLVAGFELWIYKVIGNSVTTVPRSLSFTT